MTGKRGDVQEAMRLFVKSLLIQEIMHFLNATVINYLVMLTKEVLRTLAAVE